MKLESIPKADKISAKEAKEKGQEFLLHGMQSAFYALDDDHSLDNRKRQEIYKQMDREMKRVERLFGYTPGSWTRG